jgi:hypothetical protein
MFTNFTLFLRVNFVKFVWDGILSAYRTLGEESQRLVNRLSPVRLSSRFFSRGSHFWSLATSDSRLGSCVRFGFKIFLEAGAVFGLQSHRAHGV